MFTLAKCSENCLTKDKCLYAMFHDLIVLILDGCATREAVELTKRFAGCVAQCLLVCF